MQIFHEQPNDWKLQIQYPTRETDEGLYECMVSSNPPILKRTWLEVVGEWRKTYTKYTKYNWPLEISLITRLPVKVIDSTVVEYSRPGVLGGQLGMKLGWLARGA